MGLALAPTIFFDSSMLDKDGALYFHSFSSLDKLGTLYES
jgi:hypothetical protein